MILPVRMSNLLTLTIFETKTSQVSLLLIFTLDVLQIPLVMDFISLSVTFWACQSYWYLPVKLSFSHFYRTTPVYIILQVSTQLSPLNISLTWLKYPTRQGSWLCSFIVWFFAPNAEPGIHLRINELPVNYIVT